MVGWTREGRGQLRGSRWGPLVSAGGTGVPSGVEVACLQTLSDLLGGESQRRDEPRGNPAPSQPGRQEGQAHHHRLSSGLGAPHGEPPYPIPPAPADFGRLPAPGTHRPSGCGRTKVRYSRSAGMQSRQGAV